MADCWTPAFFKILLKPSAPHLPLPHAFVSKYLKNKIPDNPTLESATGGHSWKVKIEKIGESYCFTHGWNSVVEDAQLGFGDFLVFKLVHQSTFRVSIFSPSGCEEYLPSSIIKIEDDDDDVHVHDDDDECSSHEDEEERDDDGKDDDDDGEEEDDDDDDGDDPLYMTTISKSHKYFLWLPSEFVELAGIGDQRVITVKNLDDEEWELALRSEKYGREGRSCLSAGWCEFRRSNELSEGDECLFKYIKNEGKLCLVKVSHKKPVAGKPRAKTPVAEAVKRKRGRPRKSPVAEVAKRKRGRPPKKSPVTEDVKRKRGLN